MRIPLAASLAIAAALAAGPARADDCRTVRNWINDGITGQEIAAATGLPLAAIATCLQPRPLPVRQRSAGRAGPPPLGSAGPPPLKAAGPPPIGAAGPPPIGAAGPPPLRAGGRLRR